LGFPNLSKDPSLEHQSPQHLNISLQIDRGLDRQVSLLNCLLQFDLKILLMANFVNKS
jgi:hypothetical protein